MTRATILEIQRMSTEDGPGIRTTVFFKGCGLGCTWCHNPESIAAKPRIVWHRDRCLDCWACVAACPEHARSFDEQGAVVDEEACTGCARCVDACPSRALEQLGSTWDVDDLLKEVLKDRAYFESSGGGVTVSGGEPVLQAPFVEPLMVGLRAESVHVALDTSGHCRAEAFLRLCSLADLVLFDLKHVDPDAHRELTGSSNERLLDNLGRLRDEMAAGRGPAELWIRTPLVPGATATAENVRGLGALIAGSFGAVVSRWELLAFNDLCRDKYERLGRPWEHEEAELLTADEMEALLAVARRSGVEPRIVHGTGSTQRERRSGARSDGGAGAGARQERGG